MAVLKRLVSFLNGYYNYESNVKTSRSNFNEKKPFSVTRKDLYNFISNAKLINIAENKNPNALKRQLSKNPSFLN